MSFSYRRAGATRYGFIGGRIQRVDYDPSLRIHQPYLWRTPEFLRCFWHIRPLSEIRAGVDHAYCVDHSQAWGLMFESLAIEPKSEGSPKSVMTHETPHEVYECIAIEGLGTIVMEIRQRTALGCPGVVSPKSDPPFQHMVGWDEPKARRWIEYRRWKVKT